MIKLEKVEVFGWEAAIRGMRNPMNSWDKSDSFWNYVSCGSCNGKSSCVTDFHIGKNDLKLMKKLSKAGNDHAKFLRMINVTVDITAPLYWWKEFDTYKVGTVANSCSTMHKIHEKDFTLDDFSHEHLIDGLSEDSLDWLEGTIELLNRKRQAFLITNGKDFWYQMIQLLPSSYNQKRTVQLNYQVLKSMYFARKNHKLDEWREFCKWCETLPYFKEVVIQNENS
jgi:hypothetical protein